MFNYKSKVARLLAPTLLLLGLSTYPAHASGGSFDGTVHVNVSLDQNSWVFGSSTASHISWNYSLSDDNGNSVDSFGSEYSVSVSLVYRGTGLCAPENRDGLPFEMRRSKQNCNSWNH